RASGKTFARGQDSRWGRRNTTWRRARETRAGPGTPGVPSGRKLGWMTGFEPAASQGYNLGDNATSRNRLNHSELAEASESSRVPEKKPSRWPLERGPPWHGQLVSEFSDQV